MERIITLAKSFESKNLPGKREVYFEKKTIFLTDSCRLVKITEHNYVYDLFLLLSSYGVKLKWISTYGVF